MKEKEILKFIRSICVLGGHSFGFVRWNIPKINNSVTLVLRINSWVTDFYHRLSYTWMVVKTPNKLPWWGNGCRVPWIIWPLRLLTLKKRQNVLKSAKKLPQWQKAPKIVYLTKSMFIVSSWKWPSTARKVNAGLSWPRASGSVSGWTIAPRMWWGPWSYACWTVIFIGSGQWITCVRDIEGVLDL